MDSRWRYATGVLALPSVIGGIAVLEAHLYWASVLFTFAALSIIWGIWPLIFGKKRKLDKTKDHEQLEQVEDKARQDKVRLRKQYSECLDIPRLLWQLYERAKKLVALDNNKDVIIREIPAIDRVLTDSGFFSRNNRSLNELKKFAKSTDNPLLNGTKKSKPKELEAVTNEFIKVLLNIQGAIDAKGYGALKLIYDDQETSNKLLSRIEELKIGLPDKILSEIDKNLYASTAVANLLYFESHVEMPPEFVTLLYLFKPASDSLIGEINSNVARLIEAFLSGEDI